MAGKNSSKSLSDAKAAKKDEFYTQMEDIAAVAIDDEVMLKRVYVGDNFIEFWAENPRFRPMIYRKEDFDSFRIIGKAVAFQGDVV
ncbi:MAG: hypothetical protein LUC29_03635 [Acidaminococcaceae bacterium]|nr:hypothetical protein [Acidaminococcaceae bacterium]